MQIRWTQCRSYDEAKNAHGVIYLHEWNGKPFYWGMCDTSVFGGSPRKIGDTRYNPRYATSYRHWIEGCLRHGGKLYIGVPLEMGQFSLQDVEQTLIARYPSEINSENNATLIVDDVQHIGDVPLSVKANDAR